MARDAARAFAAQGDRGSRGTAGERGRSHLADVELLARAHALLASAERLGADRDVAGAAGLAFQAIDLASKALTLAIDGTDVRSHRARMERVRELIQTDQTDLDFLWDIRNRDFYGDSFMGAPHDLPTDEQIRLALRLARALIDRIEAALS